MTDKTEAMDNLIAQDADLIDVIEAQAAEIERLRNEYIKNSESHVVSNLRSIADEQEEQITRLLELLNAWTELAREHLDTELAGRTFAALRDAGHG